MEKRRTNILISGAGGSGTVALINELSKSLFYELFAMDADPYAVGLYLCKNSYVVPFVKEKSFNTIVGDIIKKHNIDIYIPLIDEEIEAAYQLQTENRGLYILAPNKEFCERMLNKWNMYNLFVDNNLPVPRTYLFNEQIPIDFGTPKIIKPIVGRGSRGVQKVSSQEELEAYLILSKYKKEDLLIQEYIEGIEYTVSAVVNKEGKILAVVPKRIIRKKGITQVAVTEENYIIGELCKEVQNKLSANGPFNVQLIMQDNKPYVFEINPRFSTSVALTIAAGVNEVDILLRDFLKIEYLVPKFKSGLVMSRYYEQKYFMESDLKCLTKQVF